MLEGYKSVGIVYEGGDFDELVGKGEFTEVDDDDRDFLPIFVKCYQDSFSRLQSLHSVVYLRIAFLGCTT